MAIYTYDVTDAEALEDVPGPAGNIDETSTPIDLARVTAWRIEISGVITSTLQSAGVDADGLSEENKQIPKRIIKSFVAWKVLQAHGSTDFATSFRTEYEAHLETLRSNTELIGDAENVENVITSNVDPDDPKFRTYTAANEERGDGWSGW